MNIILRREVLLDSILKIIATCERSTQSSKGTSLPHFFYIRIEGYGSSIRLSAHNMYRRIEVMIGEVSEHEPFCVGVPGEKFAALIKNIYEDKVQLLVGGDEGLYLKVVTPGSTYKIAALDNDRFPEQEIVTIKTWQEVSFETLFDCFSRIIYCSASDDTDRSYAKSVCVTEDSFFCTDGYRLSLYPNRIIRCERPLLIPIESVRSFSNLFKEGGHEGFIYIEEQRLHFSKKSIYATTNLYGGAIPNYKSVVPAGVCVTAAINKIDAVRALKRLRIFSKTLSKISTPVELVFNLGGLTLSLDNKDFHSNAKEVLECSYDGPKATIIANILHLYEAFKNVQEDKVVVELRGSHFPVVVTDLLGEHRNVITPCR